MWCDPPGMNKNLLASTLISSPLCPFGSIPFVPSKSVTIFGKVYEYSEFRIGGNASFFFRFDTIPSRRYSMSGRVKATKNDCILHDV